MKIPEIRVNGVGGWLFAAGPKIDTISLLANTVVEMSEMYGDADPTTGEWVDPMAREACELLAGALKGAQNCVSTDCSNPNVLIFALRDAYGYAPVGIAAAVRASGMGEFLKDLN